MNGRQGDTGDKNDDVNGQQWIEELHLRVVESHLKLEGERCDAVMSGASGVRVKHRPLLVETKPSFRVFPQWCH